MNANYKLLFLALLLYGISCIQQCDSAEPWLYYVKPSTNINCPGQPCKLLTQYNVSSNSNYLFLHGIHVFSETLLIKGVTNVTLQGSEHTSLAQAVLKCSQDTSGGIVLQNVTKIEIKRLTILNCTVFGSTAISVQNSANVKISNIKVFNVHYGVYTENVRGNVSISKSIVQATATNIYISHTMSVCNDTPTDGKMMISSTIEDVYISGGESGLYIKQNQPCLNSEITVRNVYSEGSIPHGNVYINLTQYHQNSNRLMLDNITSVHGKSYYESGGGLKIDLNTNTSDTECSEEVSDLIYIANSNIHRNVAIHGGGLSVILTSLCRQTNVTLDNISFNGNEAQNGGHIIILEKIERELGQATFQITNCTFKDGQSAHASMLILIEYLNYKTISNGSTSSNKLIVSNTKFINNNVVEGNGGGISMDIIVNSSVIDHPLSTVNNVVFQNSLFLENRCMQQGSAVSLLGDHPNVFYNFTFLDVTVQEQTSTSPIARVGAVYAESVFRVNFINSSFLDNNSSALFLFNSEAYLQGTVYFVRNRGYNGGAIALCGGSYVSFHYNSQIYFLNNIAEHLGGAIFVQENCFLSRISYCFYRITFSNTGERNFVGSLVFEGNVAQAGYDIYGGQVKDCSDPTQTEVENELFQVLFGSLVQDCSSRISSNPEQVKLCSNGCPNDIDSYPILTYPGKSFIVSIAIVGQAQGLIPGVVHAVINQPDDVTIGDFQDSQTVYGNCTSVNYTVFGPTETTITLELYPEQPDGSFLDTSEDSKRATANISLEITLEKCPTAFTVDIDKNNKTVCDCEPKLKRHGVECSIDDETLQPPAGIWVGYHSADNSSALNESGMLLHPFCPIGYCRSAYPAMMVTSLDEQCSSNRTGVLCGACKEGYSMRVGWSDCKKCSNGWIGLALPLFIVCGVILVLFLRATNLTVSTATINGLIFYANIIHTNHSTFFPTDSDHIPLKLLTVFLAWLNLDFGIGLCLYSGMNTFAKILLQYLFPIYIWILMIAMIAIGRYKPGKIARFIIGRNGVQVLATLFLLSYTKLQRLIINSLHFTTLMYPNGNSEAVWLLDGNVQYLESKHILLFTIALLTLIFLIIPFTILATFAQLLQKTLNYFRPGRNSNARLWMFHDAYSGMYKDKYRFWTGLLLIARTMLLLVFSFNVRGNPNVNLLAIGLTSSFLLVFFSSATGGGMYKQKLLNLLELSFLFNLVLLSLCTLYIRQTTQMEMKQEIVTTISTGIAFITFIAILFYHLIKYTFPKHIDGIKRRITHRYHLLRQHSSESQEDVNSHDSSMDEDESCDREVDAIEYILTDAGDLELVTVNESNEESSPTILTQETTSSMSLSTQDSKVPSLQSGHE